MLLQDAVASLSPRMTIGRTLDEPIAIHELPRAEIAGRGSSISSVGSGSPQDVLAKFPHQISGGQARRVGVARALLLRPEIIVADEPTAGLDVSVQGELLNLLLDLQREFGLTYLLVSHNLNLIRRVTGRTVVMYLGQIVEDAPTRDLFDGARASLRGGALVDESGDRPAKAPSADRAERRDAERGGSAFGLPFPHPLPRRAASLLRSTLRRSSTSGPRGAYGAISRIRWTRVAIDATAGPRAQLRTPSCALSKSERTASSSPTSSTSRATGARRHRSHDARPLEERARRGRARRAGRRSPIYGLTSALGANTGKVVAPADRVAVSGAAPCARGRLAWAGDARGSGARRHVRARRRHGAGRLRRLDRGVPGAGRRAQSPAIVPCVPAWGSISVADMPPLAHLALVLIGEGEAFVGGRRVPGADALASAGLAPVALGAKDGLALFSANAVTVGARPAAARLARMLERQDDIVALSFEAFRCNVSPLDSRAQAARAAPGQAEAASRLRNALEGSGLFAPDAARRIQDPLVVSLRRAGAWRGARRAGARR